MELNTTLANSKNDKVKANMYSYTTPKCDAYVIPLRPKAKWISYSDTSYSMWQWSVHKETDLLTTIGIPRKHHAIEGCTMKQT